MIGIDLDKGKDESDSNSLLEEEPLELLSHKNGKIRF